MSHRVLIIANQVAIYLLAAAAAAFAVVLLGWFSAFVNPLTVGILAAFGLLIQMAAQRFLIAGGSDLERGEHADIYARVEAAARRVGLSMPRLVLGSLIDPIRSVSNAGVVEQGPRQAVMFITPRLLWQLRHGRLAPEAFDAIVHHELGHLEHNDVYTRLALWLPLQVATLACFCAAWAALWHADVRDALLSQPHLGLSVLFVPFIASALLRAITRSNESRADAAALRFGAGTAMAGGLRFLGDDMSDLARISKPVPIRLAGKRKRLAEIEAAIAKRVSSDDLDNLRSVYGQLRAVGKKLSPGIIDAEGMLHALDQAMPNIDHGIIAHLQAKREELAEQIATLERSRLLIGIHYLIGALRVGLRVWTGGVAWNTTHPPIEARIASLERAVARR